VHVTYAAALLFLLSEPLGAQSLRVGGISGTAKHELSTRAFDYRGYGGDLAMPINRRVSFRVGFERTQDARAYVQSTCPTFDPFQDCEPEDVFDSTAVRLRSFGMGFLVVGGETWAVEVVPQFLDAATEVAVRGARTKRSTVRQRTFRGGAVALEVRKRPWSRLPVAVSGAVRYGRVGGEHRIVLDGYEPLATGFSLKSVIVGVAFHR